MSEQGINKVFLMGRVGNDAELKFTQSGKAVMRFRMATTELYKDASGQRQEKTEWHTCTMWGKGAEAIHKHITKGKAIHVEGRLETREWEGNDGSRHRATEVSLSEVTFLPSSSSPQGGGGQGKPWQKSGPPLPGFPDENADGGGDGIPL